MPRHRSKCRRASAVFVLVLAAVPPASAQSQTYFDWLRQHAETVFSRAYTAQEEINADLSGPVNERLVYDPVLNGARFTLPGGKASTEQLKPTFQPVSSGTLMFVWESRWEAAFPQHLAEMKTQKAFMIAREGGRGDERRIEIRSRYSEARPPSVATIDVRRYVWKAPGDNSPIPKQKARFAIAGDTWTRFWTLIDFDNRQMSLWVADEKRTPVKLFDRFQFTEMEGGVDAFWFEHNSSQGRTSDKTLHIWGRNLVILKNLPDPDALVARGANVESDPGHRASDPTSVSARFSHVSGRSAKPGPDGL